MKKPTRTLYAGTMSVLVAVILLVALIGLNVLVDVLPKSWTKYDMTQNKMYSISDTTKGFLSSLDKHVTVYCLCENSDKSVVLQPFLDLYGSYSQVSVESVDTVLHPDFIKEKLGEETEYNNFSLIVESDLRVKAIDYYDMLYYYVTQIQQTVSYSDYQSLVQNATLYYQMYGIDVTDATMFFDGESQLSSAIEYVALDTIPHAYVLNSHGEAQFETSFVNYLNSLNLKLDDLDLLVSPTMPVDCSSVIINNPKTDLTDAEFELLSRFIDNGGNLMLLTDKSATSLTNLMALAAKFGVKAGEGTIIESDSYHATTSESDIYPVPNAGGTSDPSYLINYYPASNRYHTLFPDPHIIVKEDTLPENVNVYTLEATSSGAKLTDGDAVVNEEGNYAVGIAAVNSETNSKLVWYGSGSAFTDSVSKLSSYGNYIYLYTSLSYLNEKYVSQLATIYSVSLAEETLTISQSNLIAWTALAVVIIPIAIITSGITIWVIRKRK